MGSCRRILFAALIVAVISVLAWFALTPHRQRPEPTYQGRTLSQWMTAYQPRGFWSPSNPDQRKAANEAIRHMGTNALPFLLEMMEAHDSKFKLMLVRLAGRQSLYKFTFRPAELKQAMAVCAFEALGPDARPALPRLSAMFLRKAGQGRLPEAMCLVRVMSPRPGTPVSDLETDPSGGYYWSTTNDIIAAFGKPDKMLGGGQIQYDLGLNSDSKSAPMRWTFSIDSNNGRVAGGSLFSSGMPGPLPATNTAAK